MNLILSHQPHVLPEILAWGLRIPPHPRLIRGDEVCHVYGTLANKDVLTATDIQKTPDLFTSEFKKYFLGGETKSNKR